MYPFSLISSLACNNDSDPALDKNRRVLHAAIGV